MRHISLLAAMSLVAVACSPADAPADRTATEQNPYEPRVDADGYVDYRFNDNYREHLRTLSSDEFEGRAPGTRGEELTIEYATTQFERFGIEPLNDGSFLQSVPLVRIAPTRVTNMSLSHDDEESEFKYRDEMMVWTPRVVDDVSLDASDMVFVGYGIVAPEFNWNDYADLDVEGKTVVMFVNDPGFATQDDALFTGNAMTYYGRWTYKFEEAARQGAAGAIIIHETGPAGYGWGVIAGGSPVRFDMARENRNMDRSEIEGWVTADSAQKLFANAGLTLEEAHELALSGDFAPIDLNTQLSVTVENEFEYIDTHNIAGYIEGSTYPEEHIIYMAHWDHLGVEPISGDIYNGAQDNASGTAGVLSIAEEFARGEQPERSVVFLLVGAEERGLLGSAWYAENPILPIEQAVAGINMDVLNVYGPMRDFVVVGWKILIFRTMQHLLLKCRTVSSPLKLIQKLVFSIAQTTSAWPNKACPCCTPKVVTTTLNMVKNGVRNSAPSLTATLTINRLTSMTLNGTYVVPIRTCGFTSASASSWRIVATGHNGQKVTSLKPSACNQTISASNNSGNVT